VGEVKRAVLLLLLLEAQAAAARRDWSQPAIWRPVTTNMKWLRIESWAKDLSFSAIF